jgi:hypothetical protein
VDVSKTLDTLADATPPKKHLLEIMFSAPAFFTVENSYILF